MPARSTVLQRVLFQIHASLDGMGFVEESAFLRDLVTGQSREVDVIIRSRIAGHDVLVSVEVREQSRKAGVEWVEQMSAKHMSLPTSKLVLVSRRGFTRAASAKATTLGIDAYSVDHAEAADWSALLGEGSDPKFEVWAFRILECAVVLTSQPKTAYRSPPCLPLYSTTGELCGTLDELVRPHTDGDTAFMEKVLAFVKESNDSIHGAILRVKPARFLRDGTGTLHEIAEIIVFVEVIDTGDGVQLACARYRGAPIAYGQGQSHLGEYTIALTQQEDGSPSGSMSVRDAATGKLRTASVSFPPDRQTLVFVSDVMRLDALSSWPTLGDDRAPEDP